MIFFILITLCVVILVHQWSKQYRKWYAYTEFDIAISIFVSTFLVLLILMMVIV